MLAAPGLPQAAPAALSAAAPIIVVGFLSSASGLGQAARLAYRALERQGRNVLGVDLSQHFFESAGAVDFAFVDGRTHRGPARVLVNINAPYMNYVFKLLGRRFLKDKYVTGYWAWELPRAPEAWRVGFARVHDIATPSAFVAEALAKLGGAPPIKVAPHPVAIEALPEVAPRASSPSDAAPFTIVSAFNAASGFERKNPIALIKAFRTAFGDRRDRRLKLNVSNIQHYPQGHAALMDAASGAASIEVSFETFDRPAYWRWFGAPDLYASLHRAEGFGLPLAEAMCLGVPALATNWSANTEFMDETNALLVRCDLVPINDPQAKYAAGDLWADADVAHASELMRRVAEDEALRLRIGAAGQAAALRKFASFAFPE